MYQALSHFSVLQAKGSWMRAWEQGYISSLRDNVSLCEDLFPRARYEAIFCYVLTLFLSTKLSLCRCTGLLSYLMNKLAHTGFASHASKIFYLQYFDHFQYVNSAKEGLGNVTICGDIR